MNVVGGVIVVFTPTTPSGQSVGIRLFGCSAIRSFNGNGCVRGGLLSSPDRPKEEYLNVTAWLGQKWVARKVRALLAEKEIKDAAYYICLSPQIAAIAFADGSLSMDHLRKLKLRDGQLESRCYSMGGRRLIISPHIRGIKALDSDRAPIAQ